MCFLEPACLALRALWGLDWLSQWWEDAIHHKSISKKIGPYFQSEPCSGLMVFESSTPPYICRECRMLGLMNTRESSDVILENAIKDSPRNHVLEASISAVGGGSGPLNWSLILQISLLRAPVSFLASPILLCPELSVKQLVVRLACGNRGI